MGGATRTSFLFEVQVLGDHRDGNGLQDYGEHDIPREGYPVPSMLDNMLGRHESGTSWEGEGTLVVP